MVVESRLPLLPLSPEPLLEAPCECDTESRLPLLLDSPLPLLGDVLAVIIVGVLDSRRCHSLATSDLKSEMAVWCESRLDFEPMLLIPESALDSLLFRLVEMLGVGPASVVDWRPHGSDLAKSAKVSLLHSCFWRLFVDPPHSRKMSVSWARELRRRRVVPEVGGEVSWVSVGGEMLHICVAESLRPPSRCLIVDSSTCSRTRSSQPFPPCHTSPTWCDRMGRLQTKQMAVIVL